jgi:peptidoglycan LD-endopeptidase LytH
MPLECLEVNSHVGKFRHAMIIIERVRTFVTLATGWIVGGALLVLLGGLARQPPGVLPVAVAGTEVILPLERPGAPAGRSGRQVAERIMVMPGALIAIPVAGVVGSDLRDTFVESRGGGRLHGAIDILAPRGTPVVAAVDGTIRKLYDSRAGGLTIYQFDTAEDRVYYYAHLDAYAEGLREGDVVGQGTVIGYVGTTGNAAPDTPHLHFSVEELPPSKEWWKGRSVNPYPLLTGAPDAAASD